jgi:hypothetical protein
MIDGMTVVDAHMHVPRLSTVTPAWLKWAVDFGQESGWREVFGADGDPDPARLDALLAAEGVDTALLFAEYSPRATGIQPVEDLLPIIAYDPDRFRLVANVNPELHPFPVTEAERQLDLGAVALKVHPVHGGFRPDTRDMYAVYELCAERRVPVIVHTGGSIFPGSRPEAGDPALLSQAVSDFPGVQFVLAHGGRGQWYADAARMALNGCRTTTPASTWPSWPGNGSSGPTGLASPAWRGTYARWLRSACPRTSCPASWAAMRPRSTSAKRAAAAAPRPRCCRGRW